MGIRSLAVAFDYLVHGSLIFFSLFHFTSSTNHRDVVDDDGENGKEREDKIKIETC